MLRSFLAQLSSITHCFCAHANTAILHNMGKNLRAYITYKVLQIHELYTTKYILIKLYSSANNLNKIHHWAMLIEQWVLSNCYWAMIIEQLLSSNRYWAMLIEQWLLGNCYRAIVIEQWLLSNCYRPMIIEQWLMSNGYWAMVIEQWLIFYFEYTQNAIHIIH